MRLLHFLPDREQIHGKGDTDVDEKSRPDGSGSNRQCAQNDTGDDGSETLDHGLADVNHYIGNHHREDGAGSHLLAKGLNHEAPEEELQ